MELKISIPIMLLVCLPAYADQVFNKRFLGKARGKNWSEAYSAVRQTTILTDNEAQNHFIEYDAYCFQEAGSYYGISPVLLKAISDVENNGNIHAVNYNQSSRTVDIGHMQINSFWQKHLGENYERLFNACFCTMVGAWILKQCVDRYIAHFGSR